METLIEINEIDDNYVAGYVVKTSEQVIRLTIDNGQSCCERWGYFWCNDNQQDFIGATLRDVKITDDALNEAVMKENELDPNDKWFEGGVMFVNLETDKGTLQFVAYNEHNGYYSHEAKVECQQVTSSHRL